MSNLVEELKNEHEVVVGLLGKVMSHGLISQQSKDALLLIKQGLLAHLQKEDEKLYPILNNAAKSDDRLKRLLDHFAKDMDAISEFALDFFSKYSEGARGAEFARKFGKLYATLIQRINKEELILYEEYEKLTQ